MKKKYVGRKMMERSRFIAYLKKMDAPSLLEVEKRINGYIGENLFCYIALSLVLSALGFLLVGRG